MIDVFDDIDRFHNACDQVPSLESYQLYLKLVAEEYNELVDATEANDRIEQLDALIDILVVTLGAIRAGGFNGRGAWNEVMATNFNKIDPDTGKVRKRADGKILKPEGWKPPNLKSFI